MDNCNAGSSKVKFIVREDVLRISEICNISSIIANIAAAEKDTEQFHTYATDTAKMYVKLYTWYPMSPTMHKILVHGRIVIESALLPIGQLSEEAAEARNKHFRQYRENYARKFSRESCNRDIINRLLLTSDPLLTGLRPKPKKTQNPFSKECLEMLVPTEDNEDNIYELNKEDIFSSGNEEMAD